jgi:hypothetical protein
MYMLKLPFDSRIRTFRFQTNFITFCSLSFKNTNNKSSSSNNNNKMFLWHRLKHTKPPHKIRWSDFHQTKFIKYRLVVCSEHFLCTNAAHTEFHKCHIFRNRTPSKGDKFAGTCHYYNQLSTVALLMYCFKSHQSCLLNIISQWVNMRSAIHKKKLTENLYEHVCYTCIPHLIPIPAKQLRTALKKFEYLRIYMVVYTGIVAAGMAQSVQRLAKGLHGPGIESQRRKNFLHPSRPALGPTRPPVWWAPNIFSRGWRTEPGVDHTKPSSAEVK